MGGLNAQSCSLKHRIGWLPGCTGPELPPPPTARHRAGGAHAAPLHEAHGEAPLQRLAAHGDALQHGARATLQAAPRRARLARAAACLAGTQPHAHAPATARTRPRLCLRPCHRHRTPAPISVAQIAYVSQYLGVDSVVQPHLMWVASAALCDMLAPALPAGWEKARLTMPALTTALLLTMAPPCIARGPRFAMTVLTVGGHALALAPSS